MLRYQMIRVATTIQQYNDTYNIKFNRQNSNIKGLAYSTH